MGYAKTEIIVFYQIVLVKNFHHHRTEKKTIADDMRWEKKWYFELKYSMVCTKNKWAHTNRNSDYIETTKTIHNFQIKFPFIIYRFGNFIEIYAIESKIHTILLVEWGQNLNMIANWKSLFEQTKKQPMD